MANIESTKSFLEVLLSNLAIMESEMESAMSKYSLVVGDFDVKLRDSHWLEWPAEISESPGDAIGFHYYKAMRLKSTTSSAYIRRRYEEASRDMTGNGVIDFLYLVDVTKKEALLIQDFITNRGDILGTASEQILKNFQVWIQTAIIQTKRLYKEFKTETQRGDSAGRSKAQRTSQEVRRSQALLKVDLNGYNRQIVNTLDVLVHSFSDRAAAFYGRFLSGIEVADSERLGLLSEDQELRSRLHQEKMDLLLNQIPARDDIRQRIWDLSEVGRSMPVSGPAVMIQNAEITPEEIQYWKSIEDQADVDLEYSAAVADTPKDFLLQGTHNNLPGLLDGDPHSQYLLKSGGTATGDIEAEEGVRFDGVDLDLHRHTGGDGSIQVRGEDIEPETLEDELVDTEDVPPTPINLTTARMDLTIVPPGVTVVDTFMTYDSYDRYIHEMEIRRVPEGQPPEEQIELVNPSFKITRNISYRYDLELRTVFEQRMLAVQEDGYQVYDFTEGEVGSVLASGSYSIPSDYNYFGSLTYIGENETTFFVAHVYNTVDFQNYARLEVQMVEVDKLDSTVTQAGSPVVLHDATLPAGPGAYAEHYGSAACVYNGNRLVAFNGLNTGDDNGTDFRILLASCAIDSTTGQITDPVLLTQDIVHTQPGLYFESNYVLATSRPIILANGDVAALATTGVHVNSPTQQQGCYIYIVDPASPGVVDSIELNSDPTYWGAASMAATENGLIVSGAIMQTSFGLSEPEATDVLRGDWKMWLFSYDGQSLTQQDSIAFTNADYIDSGAWSPEWAFSGFGPAHQTAIVGGSNEGRLVTVYYDDDNRLRWAMYDWSITDNAINLNSPLYYDVADILSLGTFSYVEYRNAIKEIDPYAVADDGWIAYAAWEATSPFESFVIGANLGVIIS